MSDTEALRLSRGDVVNAHCYGGEVRQSRVVRRYEYRTGVIVVICNEREWEASVNEVRDPTGVGFPASDIEGVTK